MVAAGSLVRAFCSRLSTRSRTNLRARCFVLHVLACRGVSSRQPCEFARCYATACVVCCRMYGSAFSGNLVRSWFTALGLFHNASVLQRCSGDVAASELEQGRKAAEPFSRQGSGAIIGLALLACSAVPSHAYAFCGRCGTCCCFRAR